MKILGASLLLVALLAPTKFACAEEEKSSKTPTNEGEQGVVKPARDERFDRETPGGTLRSFTLGVMLGNEKLIKLTALPVSDEDMKYLIKKVNGLKSTPKELKEFWGSRSVQVLKVGDKFTLPGKDEMVIGKEDVNDEQMVVVLEGSPIPTRLYKGKGYWWVDPSPLIAARKAGEEAMEKRKEEAKQHVEKQQEKEAPATK